MRSLTSSKSPLMTARDKARWVSALCFASAAFASRSAVSRLQHVLGQGSHRGIGRARQCPNTHDFGLKYSIVDRSGGVLPMLFFCSSCNLRQVCIKVRCHRLLRATRVNHKLTDGAAPFARSNSTICALFFSKAKCNAVFKRWFW